MLNDNYLSKSEKRYDFFTFIYKLALFTQINRN